MLFNYHMHLRAFHLETIHFGEINKPRCPSIIHCIRCDWICDGLIQIQWNSIWWEVANMPDLHGVVALKENDMVALIYFSVRQHVACSSWHVGPTNITAVQY